MLSTTHAILWQENANVLRFFKSRKDDWTGSKITRWAFALHFFYSWWKLSVSYDATDIWQGCFLSRLYVVFSPFQTKSGIQLFLKFQTMLGNWSYAKSDRHLKHFTGFPFPAMPWEAPQILWKHTSRWNNSVRPLHSHQIQHRPQFHLLPRRIANF